MREAAYEARDQPSVAMPPSVARSSSSVSVVRHFNAHLMIISPLADLPDAIETLAQWFYDEWHAFDGRPMENIATQLSENLNRDFMRNCYGQSRGTTVCRGSSLRVPGFQRHGFVFEQLV